MGTMADLPDDASIPLAEAVRLFFPFGGVSVASLRTEARKGRLELHQIAGKDFVTPAAIREMKEQCRVLASRPASKSETADGSSETDRHTSAQDAMSAIEAALKPASRDTYGRKARRDTRPSAAVIPMTRA